MEAHDNLRREIDRLRSENAKMAGVLRETLNELEAAPRSMGFDISPIPQIRALLAKIEGGTK